MAELINPEPQLFAAIEGRSRDAKAVEREADENARDPIDALEVYDLIKDIKDPEHPNSLEQLRVVCPEDIAVSDERSTVKVLFTPTVPHCSMTTLIGLCIRVKLMRCLPGRFKVDVRVAKGSHDQEEAVNKQLGDKERVAAALENDGLLNVVASCLVDIDPNAMMG